jgi:hypothetical protein
MLTFFCPAPSLAQQVHGSSPLSASHLPLARRTGWLQLPTCFPFVPFLQPLADRNFQLGFNNIYNWNLGFSLRRIYRKHHHLFVEATERGDKGELRTVMVDLVCRAQGCGCSLASTW